MTHWYANVTGVEYTDPFASVLEDRVNRKADNTGQQPNDLWKQLIGDGDPLLTAPVMQFAPMQSQDPPQ